jgi:putative oxidoreductase
MNTPGIRTRITDAYSLLARIVSWLQSPLLLVVRLYWGSSFFQTGWGKLQHLDKITAYFADLHVPNPGFNAALVGCTECFGGLLLLVGFASRLTAIPLIITMISAYAFDPGEHSKALGFFTDQDTFIGSTPLTYLIVVLTIFTFGPGCFSVDWILGKIYGRRASETLPPPQSA